MFFANDEHKQNYELLMRMYKIYQGDAQYHCNIYMASYPVIFNCIQIDNIDIHISPLFALTKWCEVKEQHVVSASSLTGSTLMLVKAALSSYNGRLIGLDDVFSYIRDDEQLKVLFMMMKIRARVNKI